MADAGRGAQVDPTSLAWKPRTSRKIRTASWRAGYPVVLGAGERLFGETSHKKPMRLLDTWTVGDGLALLTYELVR